MRSRILLATKVPFHFQKFLRKKEKLPSFQAQFFWLKALRELGYPVKLFLYNENFFLPRTIFLKINHFLQLNFPLFYEKIRLGLNRFYFLNPENYPRNFSFIKLVARWQPDYLFLSGGVSEIFAQSLKIAKKKGAKILVFYGVSPKIGLTRTEKVMIPFFDWIITNDKNHALEWQKLGIKNAYCLPYAAIDPEFHRPVRVDNKKFYSEVCFVGTLTATRQKKLAALRKRLPFLDLKIWGYVPPFVGLREEIAPIYKGEAWGKEMVRVLSNAKIALNFLPEHMPVGGNMRTFEIPGCGALQLVDRIDSSWFKVGKEVVVFKDLDDLEEKIRYYLKNEQERKSIAQAGYRRAHQDHTYKKRFKKLLTEIEV